MLYKAYILEINNTTFKIRVPDLEKAGTNSQCILYATMSYQPGNINNYSKGDVVFISFEANEYSKPVILGKLYLTPTNEAYTNNAILNSLKVKGTSIVGDLIVKGKLTLGDNLLFDDITANNITINNSLIVNGTTTLQDLIVKGKLTFDNLTLQNLEVANNITTNTLYAGDEITIKGLDGGVKENFNEIKNDITSINNNISTINNSITSIDESIGKIEEDITSLDTRVTANEDLISKNEDDIAELNTKVNTQETKITDIDNRVTTNTNSINTINTTIEAMDEELTTLGQQVNTNTTNITNLTKSVEDNTTSINTLTTKVDTNTSNITKNTNSITTINSNISTIQENARRDKYFLGMFDDISDETNTTITIKRRTGYLDYALFKDLEVKTNNGGCKYVETSLREIADYFTNANNIGTNWNTRVSEPSVGINTSNGSLVIVNSYGNDNIYELANVKIQYELPEAYTETLDKEHYSQFGLYSDFILDDTQANINLINATSINGTIGADGDLYCTLTQGETYTIHFEYDDGNGYFTLGLLDDNADLTELKEQPIYTYFTFIAPISCKKVVIHFDDIVNGKCMLYKGSKYLPYIPYNEPIVRRGELSNVNKNINDKINELNTQVATNTSNISKNTSDITSLKTSVSTNTSDIASIKTKNTQQDTSISNLQDSVNVLTKENYKSLYNLGVFDTIDVNDINVIIYRRTGYLVIDASYPISKINVSTNSSNTTFDFYNPLMSDYVYYNVYNDNQTIPTIQGNLERFRTSGQTITDWGYEYAYSFRVVCPSSTATTINELVEYLKNNPIYLQYQLANEYKEIVEINHYNEMSNHYNTLIDIAKQSENLFDLPNAVNDGWAMYMPFNLKPGAYILSSNSLDTPLVGVKLWDRYNGNTIATLRNGDYGNNLKSNPTSFVIPTNLDLTNVSVISFHLNTTLSGHSLSEYSFMLNKGDKALQFQAFAGGMPCPRGSTMELAYGGTSIFILNVRAGTYIILPYYQGEEYAIITQDNGDETELYGMGYLQVYYSGSVKRANVYWTGKIIDIVTGIDNALLYRITTYS